MNYAIIGMASAAIIIVVLFGAAWYHTRGKKKLVAAMLMGFGGGVEWNGMEWMVYLSIVDGCWGGGEGVKREWRKELRGRIRMK